MATKRNRVDSRAHTPCPSCQKRMHGGRGLQMHLVQVHKVAPEAAEATVQALKRRSADAPLA